MAYELINNWLPDSMYALKSPYYMTPEGIVVHNNAGKASAVDEVAYMVSNGNATSFHVGIDESYVVEAIPFNRNAFHAGDGVGVTSANRCLIGIEICRSMDYSDDKYDRAETNAVEYIAQVCLQMGWDSGYLHQHNWYSNTTCPHRLKDHWEQFKARVDARIAELKIGGNTKPQADINEPSSWAKDAWDKAHELGLLDGTRPHDNVTREELATVLVRLSEK